MKEGPAWRAAAPYSVMPGIFFTFDIKVLIKIHIINIALSTQNLQDPVYQWGIKPYWDDILLVNWHSIVKIYVNW